MLSTITASVDPGTFCSVSLCTASSCVSERCRRSVGVDAVGAPGDVDSGPGTDATGGVTGCCCVLGGGDGPGIVVGKGREVSYGPPGRLITLFGDASGGDG
jgi:hypothetical protein